MTLEVVATNEQSSTRNPVDALQSNRSIGFRAQQLFLRKLVMRTVVVAQRKMRLENCLGKGKRMVHHSLK